MALDPSNSSNLQQQALKGLNNRLGLYGAEHWKCNHMVTVGSFKGLISVACSVPGSCYPTPYQCQQRHSVLQTHLCICLSLVGVLLLPGSTNTAAAASVI